MSLKTVLPKFSCWERVSLRRLVITVSSSAGSTFVSQLRVNALDLLTVFPSAKSIIRERRKICFCLLKTSWCSSLHYKTTIRLLILQPCSIWRNSFCTGVGLSKTFLKCWDRQKNQRWKRFARVSRFWLARWESVNSETCCVPSVTTFLPWSSTAK